MTEKLWEALAWEGKHGPRRAVPRAGLWEPPFRPSAPPSPAAAWTGGPPCRPAGSGSRSGRPGCGRRWCFAACDTDKITEALGCAAGTTEYSNTGGRCLVLVLLLLLMLMHYLCISKQVYHTVKACVWFGPAHYKNMARHLICFFKMHSLEAEPWAVTQDVAHKSRFTWRGEKRFSVTVLHAWRTSAENECWLSVRVIAHFG